MLYVKVPATSANVCVGFDTLGLSLDLYNEFWFEECDEYQFRGFDENLIKTDNLILKSYEFLFRDNNVKPKPVLVKINSNIPISRGLGSSSSLIVAGLTAANYYLGKKYSINDLFQIGSLIEGHPDNIAPAFFGGLTACYLNNGNYKCINYDISSNLKFITVIPKIEVLTESARKILPDKYDRRDVVWNISHSVNIPYAFEKGNVNLIYDLFDDKIHEPYRKKLINNYEKYKDIAKENHLPLYISGSGSTMIVISNDDKVELFDKFGDDVILLNKGNGVSYSCYE